ncbi:MULTISPECIES: hypothetical protein [Lelliottia]|uniref:Uncharacterized protein n=1 Tax=Lelliottia aquatilis TaxID=2080838 RepID=A0ABX5A4T7_9ENTR|nr:MULTISPECIES: hypothetical protein [Lelliottia]NTZ45835.1 hypothetical protein [Lelliottia aquatilis]POZ24070.1 hypothetical protein C3712_07600 [Lelliottia aquatilis]POZ27528.1 hypothetical protein C3708_08055 [Lelliottia sp. 7254-16]POZ29799.1 hypothetical protein C3711_01265 [Lelliottia aquatilis]POZ35364.1 hypothetical protein C3710_01265 [Lelliottia aquatilis]
MNIRSILKWALLAGLLCASAARAECDVSVSETTVDYGKLSNSEISSHRGGMYSLDEREVRVNAICSEPQTMALFISDTSGFRRFRFGSAGVLVISAQQGLLDGRSVDLGKTLTHGSFTPNQERNRRKLLVLNNDGLLPVRNGEVQIGQQFSFLLHIHPVLKPGLHSAQDEEDLLTNLGIQLESQ